MAYRKINEGYTNLTHSGIEDIMSEYHKLIAEYLENDIMLFRGSNLGTDAMLVDTSDFNRTASETHNYINMLTGYLPSWNNWPDRRKSLIFTADINDAREFGSNIYRVIPLSFSKMAASLKEDFWDALPVNIPKGSGISNIMELNEVIDRILSFIDQLGIPITYKSTTKPEYFIKCFDRFETILKMYDWDIDELCEDNHLYNNFNDIETNFINLMKDTSPIDFFDKILDPSVNNHQIYDLTEVSRYGGEIWGIGKFLLINSTQWISFVDNFNKRGLNEIY
jgi:hypothetical protein